MKKTTAYKQFLVLFLSSYVLCGFAFAEIVTFQLSAEVSIVNDNDNILEGNIKVGDTITGQYSYDTSVSDSSPFSTIGRYNQSSPSGIELNVNDMIFKTNPFNVDFIMEIVDDHGTPKSDNYLIRSYNNYLLKSYKNIATPSSIPVGHISWQLDDSSLKAISSIDLTNKPPVLANWQSIFGLTIEGELCDFCESYFIRAHVNSIEIASEEPPQISFKWNPETPLVGQEVTFTAEPYNGEPNEQWQWVFDDGTTAQGKIVTHRFTEEKTFLVDLVFLDSNMNLLAEIASPVQVVCKLNSTPSSTPKDCDDDALPNEWEIEGWGFNTNTKDKNGNIVIVDLSAMGADPLHKDIFVEIDYMQNSDHSHRPLDEAIKNVITAFAKAKPIKNPNGENGINLHVEIGEGLSHEDNIGGFAFNTSLFDWGKFDNLKKDNFVKYRENIFHYAISVHNVTLGFGNSSGVAKGNAFSDISGSDFMIAVGQSTIEQSGTFMHELGHNLGLRHGGNENNNYKPNYLSIMNYFYQLSGLRRGKEKKILDYSYGNAKPLNKFSLNEPDGVLGIPDHYKIRYYCGEKMWSNSARPIDWNCDGNELELDVSELIDNGGENLYDTSFTDYNDWNNLVFSGGSIGDLGISNQQKNSFTLAELTRQEVENHKYDIEAIISPMKHINYANPSEVVILQYKIINKGLLDSEFSIIVESDNKEWIGEYDSRPTKMVSGEIRLLNIPITIPNEAKFGAIFNIKVKVNSIVQRSITSSTIDKIIISSPNDTDSDGVSDISDNCPNYPNPKQLNKDADYLGDWCDDYPRTFNILGDIDNDGDVDRSDIAILLQNKNTVTSEETASMDIDGDGKITALDARKLSRLCTRPRCAI